MLAAAGVLTLYGGLSAVGTIAASAATPQCGQACVEVYTAMAVTAYQDESLSLQPCGSPGTTVWILDFGDSPATAPTSFPIVNGSDTDVIHPFAMTIVGNPAHQPFTPIIMQHLTGNPDSVPANQL